MESWLQGLRLSRDGFFAGFAIFERGEPRQIRYRLEASDKKGGLFAEGEDSPDREELSFSQAMGWEFVARWGDFFIFSSENSQSCELHTDPQVQAIALNKIRRRAWADAAALLFQLLLYPLLWGNGFLLASFIQVGTPLYLLFQAVIFWSAAGSLRSALHLRRLYRRLRAGQPLNHRKDWRRRSRRYRASQILCLVLTLAVAGLLLRLWSIDASGENQIPLAEYQGELPFPTMEDLLPGAAYTASVMDYTNYVEEKSDLLAPAVFSFSQNGRLALPGDGALSGGLTVEYYETLAPWMARELAREYEQYDRRRNGKHYAPLEVPPGLGVDYAAAYTAIFPTVILTEGNRMLRVSFYQNPEGCEIPLEEWAAVFARSLQG